MSSPSPNLLRLGGVTHRHGERTVLHGIDFDLESGEIHALIGDHKAGKTTLAHILGGIEQLQEGIYELRGKRLRRLTKHRAPRAGIAIVQEQKLVMPTLSAARNMSVGNLRGFLIRTRDELALAERCTRLLERLDIDIDLRTPLRLLSDEEQKGVELVRVLARQPDVLILDEISSRFNPHRLKRVFSLLSDLKAEGCGIVFVTPDVEQIFQFADRVTVLRDGERIGTERVRDLDRMRLVRMAYEFTSYFREGEGEGGTLYLRRQNEQLIRNLPIGAIVLDTQGHVFSVNGEAEKLLQKPDLEPGETTLEDVMEHLGINDFDELAVAVESREARTWEDVKISGSRTVRLASYPIKSFDGQSQGTILFIENFLMDDLVKEYLARAEQMTSIAELAAGVAHEINNPLGIIQNYLELLKVADTEVDRGMYLERIEGEVRLITEVVRSLLSFSRVKQLPVRRVDISQLIEETLLLVGHRLRDKHIEVKRYFSSEAVYVVGLETKLKQLFVNIIVNGIEAMLDGGTLRVSLNADPRIEQVSVSIADSGHGIPADLQDDVFKPFFSTKVTKNNAGLGLSVCQHIVDVHRGVITFTSRPGETEFTVGLPTRPIADAE